MWTRFFLTVQDVHNAESVCSPLIKRKGLLVCFIGREGEAWVILVRRTRRKLLCDWSGSPMAQARSVFVSDVQHSIMGAWQLPSVWHIWSWAAASLGKPVRKPRQEGQVPETLTFYALVKRCILGYGDVRVSMKEWLNSWKNSTLEMYQIQKIQIKLFSVENK